MLLLDADSQQNVWDKSTSAIDQCLEFENSSVETWSLIDSAFSRRDRHVLKTNTSYSNTHVGEEVRKKGTIIDLLNRKPLNNNSALNENNVSTGTETKIKRMNSKQIKDLLENEKRLLITRAKQTSDKISKLLGPIQV